jgi:hypothetical protein
VEYNFSIGNLTPGVHYFTFQWLIADESDIGCFRNAANEAQMRAGGSSTLISSSKINFSITCPSAFVDPSFVEEPAVEEAPNFVAAAFSWLVQTVGQLFRI